MSDAWWVRPPTPTLPQPEAPAPEGADADPGWMPDLAVLDAAPQPTTVLLTRKQAHQLRRLRNSHSSRGVATGRSARTGRTRPSKASLALSGVGLLAVVAAGLGGMALAERPATTVTTVAAPAVPVDLSLVTATATSTQKADGTTTYAAVNTLDGDPATAWNSDGARAGKGHGISLTYTFARPLDLRDIVLRNGYQKVRPRAGKSPLDLYRINERARRLRVVTDAGTWVWDLADTRTPQAFAGATGRTGSVRLEIISVYPSKTYPDVAISEVGFTAAPDR